MDAVSGHHDEKGQDMKMYSDYLTDAHVRAAFANARMEHGAHIVVDVRYTWRPRQIAHGVDFVAFSVNGTRKQNSGVAGARGAKAATWEAWRYVIAYLFNIDPHARIGQYNNEADFVKKVTENAARGASLAFLATLTNIREYTDVAPEVYGMTICDECGAMIPDTETSTINAHHEDSCSAFSGNVS
jgi:hypothetical protein